MPDRLRSLWDFDDLDATEVRLREQLDREESDSGRAEVLTQLAEAEQLAGDDPVANIRVELERGRMLRSSGDPAAAFPLFESAYEHALDANETFFAGDAAHMCAVATVEARLHDPGNPEAIEWARESGEEAKRALGRA